MNSGGKTDGIVKPVTHLAQTYRLRISGVVSSHLHFLSSDRHEVKCIFLHFYFERRTLRKSLQALEWLAKPVAWRHTRHCPYDKMERLLIHGASRLEGTLTSEYQSTEKWRVMTHFMAIHKAVAAISCPALFCAATYVSSCSSLSSVIVLLCGTYQHCILRNLATFWNLLYFPVITNAFSSKITAVCWKLLSVTHVPASL